MAVKVFILGRPGSGKTTVARYIEKFAKKHHNWSTIQFNDYEVYAGFNIFDFSGLDRAEIALLEKHVRQKYSLKDEFIVIELRAKTTSDVDPPMGETYRALIPSNLKDFLFALVALVYLVFAAIHFCLTGDGSMLTCLLGAVAGYAGVKGVTGKINQRKDKSNL